MKIAVQKIYKPYISDIDCKIEKQPSMGGDYDLPSLYLTPKGSKEWIRIVPFITDPKGLQGIADKTDIELVELRTNGDDRGGFKQMMIK